MRPSRTEGNPEVLRAGCMPSLRHRRPYGRLGALAVTIGMLVPATTAQAQSGSIIIGESGQTASQEQTTSIENEQENGSITIGDATQANEQQATTDQSISQEQIGTFVVLNGALQQNASQSANTELENSQLSGGLIVGDLLQGNRQTASTTQDIDQVMNGTFIVLGDSMPVDARLVGAVNALNGCAVCTGAMRDGPVLAGGDLNTSRDSVDGTYIVFGDLTQSASQDSSIRELNDQERTGSIIIGDTEQTNEQDAVTNQDIDQSLTGTYIVFGTLEQNADQNADTVLINQQEQGASDAG